MKNISGVILAGGANRRFKGLTKANIVIEDLTIISRMVSTIDDLFDEIIIVTDSPEKFVEYKHFMIVGDQFQRVGPLGGIHTAMKASTKQSVFVFASDMPFIDKELISGQIDFYNKLQTEALIPQINNDIEPLHAIYRNSISARLENYLLKKQRYAIRDFILNISVSYFKLSQSEKTERAFTNINSPSEFNSIKEHYKI